MRHAYLLFGSALFGLVAACDGETGGGALIGGGGSENGGYSGSNVSGGGAVGGSGPSIGGTSGGYIDFGDAGTCPPTSCAALGWACGYTVDTCGNLVDCAAEGLTCAANQVCVGGIDGPTVCAVGADASCALCSRVPDCSAAGAPTRLTGRVVTPGRDDANTANQVGVPNAVVYIMRTDQIADLPAIPTGIPGGGTSCDRCEEQDLGPLLAGAITDALGNFTIEGNVPVGVQFLLVVKAGKFRRVVPLTLPAEAACQSTALPTTLPDNPTRLPRTLSDGLAVNIPKIAVSTGRIDAMECVFEKMGIADTEFGNFGSAASVQLYRGVAGTEGATIDGSTPADTALYADLSRLENYDMVVSDCEGQSWDSSFVQRDAQGGSVRDYVNRGGRMFLSHLSFSWLHQNGATPYDGTSIDTARATGLGQSSTWFTSPNTNLVGTGVVSIVGGRPPLQVSPRIQTFAEWMVNESVTTAPGYSFRITDPRSQNESIAAGTEEFVYRSDAAPETGEANYSASGNGRVQQFSFNTPFGAPPEAACGRVAYSGFHVAATGGQSDPFIAAVFPTHCAGDLTNQEKVLLYMLFDLGACVGDQPLPPPCVPITCEGSSGGRRCGFAPDGCGDVLDCGPCRPPA
jgi:hypothetical protein